MTTSQHKTRTAPSPEELERRRVLAETMPQTGKVRAPQCAAFLGIGLSTFWLYVKERRIRQPQRYSRKISVWDCEYIRELADNGIPEIVEEVA